MTSYTFLLIGTFCILAVSAHRGSHSDESKSKSKSDEKDCGTCGEIKRSCRDYYGSQRCSKPKITYLKDKHGCQSAMIRCRGEPGVKTLKTSRDDTLFAGEGSEKWVSCKKDKWHADDFQGDRTRFHTVYCLDDNVNPAYPGPYFPPPQQPAYPVNPPAPY